MADFEEVARLRAVGGDGENPAIDGFDFLRGFVAFEGEEGFAFFDKVSLFLQPCEELPFLHGPAETRELDFDGHESVLLIRREGS
jgi:hypothetical protein